MQEKEEIDIIIRALQSIRLYRDFYASSHDGIKHLIDVINMLKAMGESKRNHGPYGGLLLNVAEALSKAYLLRNLSEMDNDKNRKA